MKGMTAFACISDIDLELIEESMSLFAAPKAVAKEPSRLSRFLNSGWGVAMICTLVSVAVLSAMVWAGRQQPVKPPVPGTVGADTTGAITETHPETQAPVASEGLEFRSNGDGTCTVMGRGTCRDRHVVIPALSPEGDRVTYIIKRAFEGDDSLISVYVPDTVQRIGESAFEGCSALSEVILSESLTEIGPNAFEACVSLRQMVIPQTVSRMGAYAFWGCTGLVSIELPDRMDLIGEGAFQDCSALTEITWPRGMEEVSLWVLWNASSLTRVTLSEDVTVIRGMAFEGCTSLERLVIPLGLARVESRAFYGCRSLQQLHYAGNRTQWQRVEIHNEGNEALSHAILYENSFGEGEHGLYPDVIADGVRFISHGDGTCKVKGADKTWEGVIIVPERSPYGDVVTTVATGGFKDCSRITSVTLPDTVTVIKTSAFQNCGALQHIDLPAEVTEFGSALFDRCGELESVVLPKGLTEIPAMTFQTCVSLQSVVAQEGVTSIGANAFNGSRSLETLTLPAGLRSIGSAAFMNCCGLRTIYYGGDRAEWRAVEVHSYENAHLGHADVVFAQN